MPFGEHTLIEIQAIGFGVRREIKTARRHRRAGASGFELRGSCGARDAQRPANGLFGHRTYRSSCRAYGTDSCSGKNLDYRSDTPRLRRSHRRHSARLDSDQGNLVTPQAVFELSGARTGWTRFGIAGQPVALTRLIGREVEMGVLKQALLQAAKGNGQIVSLVGEPGVGKSRIGPRTR